MVKNYNYEKLQKLEKACKSVLFWLVVGCSYVCGCVTSSSSASVAGRVGFGRFRW